MKKDKRLYFIIYVGMLFCHLIYQQVDAQQLTPKIADDWFFARWPWGLVWGIIGGAITYYSLRRTKYDQGELTINRKIRSGVVLAIIINFVVTSVILLIDAKYVYHFNGHTFAFAKILGRVLLTWRSVVILFFAEVALYVTSLCLICLSRSFSGRYALWPYLGPRWRKSRV